MSGHFRNERTIGTRITRMQRIFADFFLNGSALIRCIRVIRVSMSTHYAPDFAGPLHRTPVAGTGVSPDWPRCWAMRAPFALLTTYQAPVAERQTATSALPSPS